MILFVFFFFFFSKENTEYKMRISDWSSDVCSSDLLANSPFRLPATFPASGKRWQRPVAPPHRPSFFVPQPYRLKPYCSSSRDAKLPRTRLATHLRNWNQVLYRWNLAVRSCVVPGRRSEERRVGKEGVSTCKSRWSTIH